MTTFEGVFIKKKGQVQGGRYSVEMNGPEVTPNWLGAAIQISNSTDQKTSSERSTKLEGQMSDFKS